MCSASLTPIRGRLRAISAPGRRFGWWFGDLELVFTGEEGEPLVFSQWYADGHLDPTGLVTPEGWRIGTVGFPEVTFPGAFVLVPPFEGDIVGIFAITNPQTGGVLNGTTLGLDPGCGDIDLGGRQLYPSVHLIAVR